MITFEIKETREIYDHLNFNEPISSENEYDVSITINDKNFSYEEMLKKFSGLILDNYPYALVIVVFNEQFYTREETYKFMDLKFNVKKDYIKIVYY